MFADFNGKCKETKYLILHASSLLSNASLIIEGVIKPGTYYVLRPSIAPKFGVSCHNWRLYNTGMIYSSSFLNLQSRRPVNFERTPLPYFLLVTCITPANSSYATAHFLPCVMWRPGSTGKILFRAEIGICRLNSCYKFTSLSQKYRYASWNVNNLFDPWHSTINITYQVSFDTVLMNEVGYMWLKTSRTELHFTSRLVHIFIT